MKSIFIRVTISALLLSGLTGKAQTTSDSIKSNQKKYQAKAPPTQLFGAKAFGKSKKTTLRWLGMAGFLINSRGATFMVDPLLEGFDMPMMIDFPILAKNIPHLDAVFVTHADNDHFSIPTNVAMSKVTNVYHSTVYVDSLMKNLNLKSVGHDIGDVFKVKNITVKLTPADHAYQNAYPGMSKRWFKNEDACGFWFDTPDGDIWATGDSRLIPEHLTMKAPDAILFDFSDSEWHFTFEGAVKIANAYPNALLLLCHWGSVDSPDFSPFNGDPKKLYDVVVNPERIKVLAPGEPFVLKRFKK
jgi:L-ascorbate metabolism protein UlaG (beta-lactamase superfamily)